jgi:hypothetical protein
MERNREEGHDILKWRDKIWGVGNEKRRETREGSGGERGSKVHTLQRSGMHH